MRSCLSLRGARWLLCFVFIFSLFAGLARADNPTEKINLGGGVTLEIVGIEPGTFVQGSPEAETGHHADETQRTVTLTQPFWMGKYPVTRGQFARFVAETNYRTEAEAGTSGGFGWDGAKLVQRKDFTWKNPGFPQEDTHPVVLVTYNDARAFVAWLTRKTGRKFALPSEAQWEYAARAGGSGAYPVGGESALRSSSGTRPVGQAALNAWGLGDLTATVWQWCEDWYAPYVGPTTTDPLQTQSNLSDKPRRVLRGGSWMRTGVDLRSASRYRNDPASRNADNGFRVMTFDAAATAVVPPVTRPAEAESSGRSAESSDVITPVTPAGMEEEEDQPANRTHSAGVRRSNSGSPLLFGLFCLGAFALFGGVFFKIIRRLSSSAGTGAVPRDAGTSNGGRSGPLRTRIGDDGFWIDSNVLPTGTVLEVRYFAGGKQHVKNVTFQGGSGGQFVFTGGRPSNVAVVVLPGGGPSSLDADDDIGSSTMGRGAGMFGGMHQPPPLPDDEGTRRGGFGGHPPAY
jgi:formylglycine-generating enzyme required for sulfatase activity